MTSTAWWWIMTGWENFNSAVEKRRLSRDFISVFKNWIRGNEKKGNRFFSVVFTTRGKDDREEIIPSEHERIFFWLWKQSDCIGCANRLKNLHLRTKRHSPGQQASAASALEVGLSWMIFFPTFPVACTVSNYFFLTQWVVWGWAKRWEGHSWVTSPKFTKEIFNITLSFTWQ